MLLWSTLNQIFILNVLNCYKYKSPFFTQIQSIFDGLDDNLFWTIDQNPAIEPSLSYILMQFYLILCESLLLYH